MREITLDTETTGLDPESGHRVVEIGCVEMIQRIRTGKYFHAYLNPQRSMPEEAYRIHGLSEEFLSDKPLFTDVAEEFLSFIGDATLVIHNAGFDLKFLNHELARLSRVPIEMSRVIDTVTMARRKYPGSPANLDALCKRFEIDLSARTKHGALLDAELLADVYVELTGGKQAALTLDQAAKEIAKRVEEKPFRVPRVFSPTVSELEAHAALITKLKNPLWQEQVTENKSS